MGGLRTAAGAGRRGRVLSVKLGMNPNSSSLGVDVTFLLFGMAALAVLVPLLGFLLRFIPRHQDRPRP